MQVAPDQNTFQGQKKIFLPNEDIQSHYYWARLEDQSIALGQRQEL